MTDTWKAKALPILLLLSHLLKGTVKINGIFISKQVAVILKLLIFFNIFLINFKKFQQISKNSVTQYW